MDRSLSFRHQMLQTSIRCRQMPSRPELYSVQLACQSLSGNHDDIGYLQVSSGVLAHAKIATSSMTPVAAVFSFSSYLPSRSADRGGAIGASVGVPEHVVAVQGKGPTCWRSSGQAWQGSTTTCTASKRRHRSNALVDTHLRQPHRLERRHDQP